MEDSKWEYYKERCPANGEVVLDWHSYKDFDLYFKDMAGGGTIYCRDCGYSEKIVSDVHGFQGSPVDTFRSGYQCQSCGKFYDLNFDEEQNDNKRCVCGGILEDDKPIFCPKCKSKDMIYDMAYIT